MLLSAVGSLFRAIVRLVFRSFCGVAQEWRDDGVAFVFVYRVDADASR